MCPPESGGIAAGKGQEEEKTYPPSLRSKAYHTDLLTHLL